MKGFIITGSPVLLWLSAAFPASFGTRRVGCAGGQGSLIDNFNTGTPLLSTPPTAERKRKEEGTPHINAMFNDVAKIYICSPHRKHENKNRETVH